MLERERELAVIAEALAAARRGEGGLVLIDGPAGVGKTTLMRSAPEAGAEMRLLTARGNELDRPFGFGIIRQLFEPALAASGADVAGLLAGAARFVPSVLDIELPVRPAEAARDSFAIHSGIYWLTANLAAREPLLLLVDDLHWADDESLDALAHLANRLDDLAVALIVACRSDDSRPGLESLRRTAADVGERLLPRPLGSDAVEAVVRSTLPEADATFCRRCHEASGGNPFLLQELIRSLAESGSADPTSILDTSPERVTREVGARLARLPAEAAALARAATVLGDGSPLPRVASLAGLDDAAAAADALVAAGIFRQASPVEFLHPLIRAGIYAGIGPAARSNAHIAAARLIAADGERAPRIATQLLRCDPSGDAWIVEVLLDASAAAMASRAPDAAASLLRRALAEPPPPELRTRVLLELGLAEAAAVMTDAALEHVGEALEGDLDPEQRLRAMVLLAGLLGHGARISEAVDVLEAQIPKLADRPDLVTQAEVALGHLTNYDAGQFGRGREIRERFARRAEEDAERDPGVLSIAAIQSAVVGDDRDRTIAVARRALASVELTSTESANNWSAWIATRTLSACEDYGEMARAIERGIEQALAVGSSLDHASWLAFRAERAIGTGDLERGEADGNAVVEMMRSSGWEAAVAFTAAILGMLLVERGEIERADELLSDPGHGARITSGYSSGDVPFARARCRMAQGRWREAAADLRDVGRWFTAIGGVNPALMPWRSQLATVLLELEETAEAGRLAAEELELARRFGAPGALARALRAVALAAGGSEEIALLREAAAVLEGAPSLLERARVHAQLGAALRRERSRPDAAREPLRTAVDLAHRCGARPLEEAALAELKATGARPRRRLASGAGALTPSERRIAELAASGRQNREIAESQFVTVDTVEFHLRNAYRKLGISGRAELAEKLAAAEGSAG